MTSSDTWDMKANHVKIMLDLLIIKNKYVEEKYGKAEKLRPDTTQPSVLYLR